MKVDASKRPRGGQAKTAPARRAAGGSPENRRVVLLACLLAVAASAAYYNCFSLPFVFDDKDSVVTNPTIRRLWSAAVFSPPHGTTMTGRPIVNLSLAANYAFGGLDVRGYHALNLAIHVVAALLLFGIVRRTLLCPGLPEPFARAAAPLAFAVSLLWAVHPLQTESAAYIAQRVESLMGMFFLLTLYCSIRGGERHEAAVRNPHSAIRDSQSPPASSLVWYVLAVVSCLLGVGSKEVIVAAPPVLFLYDRAFLAGSFRAAWRRRWGLYLALLATWGPLAWLVAGTHGRGGAAGWGTHVAWWEYALTQTRAVALYLRLALWPSPLVFDYGGPVTKTLAQAAPYAAFAALLLAATAVALWRWPRVGFAGGAFLAILAPSSSVVPIATQTIAEHRMYLPLAPLLALAVLGLYRGLGRRSLVLCLIWAAALGWLTARRNEDYRTEIGLWRDTVEKAPGNSRAHSNLGALLFAEGRIEEAIASYEKALLLKPDDAECLFNLGLAFYELGRTEDAMRQYEAALRVDPNSAAVLLGLGNALCREGRFEEAAAQYERGLGIAPNDPALHVALGLALANLGQPAEAAAHYRKALEIDPGRATAHNNLAIALVRLGRLREAETHYVEAIRLNPANETARRSLADLRRRIDEESRAANPAASIPGPLLP